MQTVVISKESPQPLIPTPEQLKEGNVTRALVDQRRRRENRTSSPIPPPPKVTPRRDSVATATPQVSQNIKTPSTVYRRITPRAPPVHPMPEPIYETYEDDDDGYIKEEPHALWSVFSSVISSLAITLITTTMVGIAGPMLRNYIAQYNIVEEEEEEEESLFL